MLGVVGGEEGQGSGRRYIAPIQQMIELQHHSNSHGYHRRPYLRGISVYCIFISQHLGRSLYSVS